MRRALPLRHGLACHGLLGACVRGCSRPCLLHVAAQQMEWLAMFAQDMR